MTEDPQKLPVPDALLAPSVTVEADPVETQQPQTETSDVEVLETEAPQPVQLEPEPPEPVPVLSAGALIRQAREEAGLHIASLAMALKVPVKRLEALEADRFDLLPSAVFSRALASSVCRALKLNPTQVLAQLPGLSAPRLGYPEESRLSPYSSGSSGQSSTFLGSLSRPALAGGALFLAGAALLIFLPSLPFQFLQREFPQLATAVWLTISVKEQVAFCSVAKRALGEVSWDKTGIVIMRQLLETDGFRLGQEGQDFLEKVGGLEMTRIFVVAARFLHR
jgi:transcriptional regulator with XRE-family HTH domain